MLKVSGVCHAHTCVKKVYFGRYIGIREAGGWESG